MNSSEKTGRAIAMSPVPTGVPAWVLIVVPTVIVLGLAICVVIYALLHV